MDDIPVAELDSDIEIEKPVIHGCGCVLKKELDHGLAKWVISDYCEGHRPNYAKRADKAIHRNEVLKKRNEYLEFKAKVKKTGKK